MDVIRWALDTRHSVGFGAVHKDLCQIIEDLYKNYWNYPILAISAVKTPLKYYPLSSYLTCIAPGEFSIVKCAPIMHLSFWCEWKLTWFSLNVPISWLSHCFTLWNQRLTQFIHRVREIRRTHRTCPAKISNDRRRSKFTARRNWVKCQEKKFLFRQTWNVRQNPKMSGEGPMVVQRSSKTFRVLCIHCICKMKLMITVDLLPTWSDMVLQRYYSEAIGSLPHIICTGSFH